MAITVVKEPTGIVPLDRAEWGFQLSDGGTDPIVKKLAYQLFDGGGIPLTKRRIVDYAPFPFYFDASSIIGAILKTPMPDPALAVQEVPEAIDEFYVEYGEIHYDIDANTTTEVGFTQTATVYVVNSIRQFWDADTDIPNTIGFLTLKPSRLQLERDQEDWIYVVIGENTIFLRGEYTTNVPVTPYPPPPDPVTSLLSYRVYAINIGTNNNILAYVPDAWKIKSAFLEFYRGLTTYKRFDITYFNTAKGGYILCHEAKGGFSSIGFDEIQYGAVRQIDTFRQHSPKLTYAEEMVQNGLHVANSKSYVEVTFRKNFRRSISAEEKAYYEAFLSSQAHFMYDLKNDNAFIKIIVQGGSWKTRGEGNTIWEIAARYHQDFEVLKSRI